MKPFILADSRDMARAARTRQELLTKLQSDKLYADKFMGKEGYTLEEMTMQLDTLIAEQLSLPCYINGDYQVTVSQVTSPDWPEMVHLSIRRQDREVIRDWRELQAIKNALVGPEHEGMEMFPAESRLVDTANQYHLFVFKDARVRFPFGFQQRHVEYDEKSTTSKQRKFDE